MRYKGDVRLITMPFSHYSEKARWALDFLGMSYTEDAYMPMMHLTATIPVGGRSVPVLVDGDAVVPDSTEILIYLDGKAGSGRRLLPQDTAERSAVLDLEEYCDRYVGTAARSWVYSEMLVTPWTLGRMLGNGRPTIQRALLPLVMTISKPVIARSYRVKPGHPEEWIGKLRTAFAEIGRRLGASTGRYLVGDTFTAADLTFASLAAPALLPPEHPAMKIDTSTVASRMRAELDELRQTPAGQHAMRMYREHRWERLRASRRRRAGWRVALRSRPAIA